MNPYEKRMLVEHEALLKERDSLKAALVNATSTIAAWDNAEIIKCGCKYNRVWGGTKWEHWLVPCEEHQREREQLKSTQAELAEARMDACDWEACAQGQNDRADRLESELAALKAQLLRCKPFVEAPLNTTPIPLGEREAILREVFGGIE